ncbi:PAS domain S-box protein [uncultured Croceicoccus sp.]|uniref:PAS domain S-box protein n=1 Tax=uncultured Croceicoccus sp. TaxID=1295329 RepID=UPI00263352C6|nr:PAS domain S-box protein [uncultured Croceicoccus sp.]
MRLTKDIVPTSAAGGVALRFALVALCYFVLAMAALQLAPPAGHSIVIWPASGVAIGALVILGYRMAGAVFLGALASGLYFFKRGFLPSAELALLAAILTAAGSTAQAAVGAFLIRRQVGFPIQLGGGRDALRLMILAAPVTCLVGTVFGVAAMVATGYLNASDLLSVSLRWWMGSMVGVLIVLPLFLLAPWMRNKVFWRKKPLDPFPALPFMAVILMLMATLVGWHMVTQNCHQRVQATFDGLVNDNAQALTNRVESYGQALDSAAGLFEISDEITPGEWRTYVLGLVSGGTLPGITGLGIIEPVADDRIAAFVAQKREAGLQGFDVHPVDDHGENLVISLAEPIETNAKAIGFNIASEEHRRQAALQARDTGEAVISDRITLVQDASESVGFLLLHPVYRPGMPTETVAQRRAALREWIYAPFIAPRFMHGLSASQNEFFDVTIYDGKRPDAARILYTNVDDDMAGRPPMFTRQKTIRVMGRDWTIVWRSTNAFEKRMSTYEAYLVLLGGLLLTLVFAAVLLAGLRREAEVRAEVDSRTAQLRATVTALRDSEREFANLTGLSPAGIFRTDPFGFCTYVNKAWLRTTGLTASRALGAGWIDAVHPDDKAHFKKVWLDAIHHSKQLRTEVRFYKPGFPPFWVDLIAAPNRDEDGNTLGFIGVAIDVSEQKRASDALKESEQRFQSLSDLSPAAIFRTAPDGMFTYVNAVWSRMTGMDARDTFGLGWTRAIHPDDVTLLMKRWFDAAAKRVAHRHEFRLRNRRDGTVFRVDAIATPEWDESGEFRGYICVAMDITERAQFEKDLAERDEQLSLLAQNATDAVFRIGLDGVCIYASPSTRDVLGVPPELLIGKNAHSHIHPEDEEMMRSAWRDLISGARDRNILAYRSRIPEIDADYRWLEANVALIRDAATGEAREVSASIRDVEDRKQLEFDLIAARRRAEAAAAAKATFLANMSHEIRTPMNGVVGFTEMLLDSDLTPDQRDKARLIADSGRAMMQILNDILDISKIDAGQMTIERQSFDLRETVGASMRVLEATARQKQLEFTLDVADDVPQTVLGDALRLRQVVTNLIGNAIKFTSSGYVRTDVTRSTHEGRDCLVIAVRDSGIGIAEDRLETIFREFSQADESTARLYGGTGLGLTISSELARMMDGNLHVESTPGEGSTFTLTIPVELTREAVTAEEETDDPEWPGFASPPRVLIAEDHDINQVLILSMADKLNLDADIAENGEEAVRMAKEAKHFGDPYALVLMDMQMPVMDGLQAARTLRAEGFDARELPIIAQTANAYREDVERCLAAGMQDHVAKPIRLDLLKKKIARWINRDLVVVTPPAPPPPVAKNSAASPVEVRYLALRRETLDAVHAINPDHADDDAVNGIIRLLHQLAGVAGAFGEDSLGEEARRQQAALKESTGDARPAALARAKGAFVQILNASTR